MIANTIYDSFSQARQYLVERKSERAYPNDQAKDDTEIACLIIEQAVKDWMALDYGCYGSVRDKSMVIYRAEVLSFFRSPWFEFLLSYALPQFTPQEIRAKLKIAEPGKDGD